MLLTRASNPYGSDGSGRSCPGGLRIGTSGHPQGFQTTVERLLFDRQCALLLAESSGHVRELRFPKVERRRSLIHQFSSILPLTLEHHASGFGSGRLLRAILALGLGTRLLLAELSPQRVSPFLRIGKLLLG